MRASLFILLSTSAHGGRKVHLNTTEGDSSLAGSCSSSYVCCSAGVLGHWCFHGKTCPGGDFGRVNFPFEGDDGRTYLLVETAENYYPIGSSAAASGSYGRVNRMPKGSWKDDRNPPRALDLSQLGLDGISHTGSTRYYGSPILTKDKPSASDHCSGRKVYPSRSQVRRLVESQYERKESRHDQAASSSDYQQRPEYSPPEQKTPGKGARRHQAFQRRDELLRKAVEQSKKAGSASGSSQGSVRPSLQCNDQSAVVKSAQDFLGQMSVKGFKADYFRAPKDCSSKKDFKMNRWSMDQYNWFQRCCAELQALLN